MKDTAKQTWEKLEELFASRSLSNKLFLKEELHSLKIQEVYKSEDNAMMLLTSQPPKGSKISLGDKTSCEVLGVGTVKIKMHDGIVRSFSEVRHVPKLRRNLISLGILDRE
ncbi:unnamed protein product [Prunus brigantina]